MSEPSSPALSYSDSKLLLARRVACDAYEATTDREGFGQHVLADVRLDGCTPDEIDTVLKLAGECYEYWLANNVTHPTAATGDLGKIPKTAEASALDAILSQSAQAEGGSEAVPIAEPTPSVAPVTTTKEVQPALDVVDAVALASELVAPVAPSEGA